MGTVSHPQLGDLADHAESRRVALDQERRDPQDPLGGVGGGEAEEQVGDRAGGDPGLAAVQDPAVAPALGAGLHAEDIRARLGLAGPVGPEQAAVAQAGQIRALLSLGAERGGSAS